MIFTDGCYNRYLCHQDKNKVDLENQLKFLPPCLLSCFKVQNCKFSHNLGNIGVKKRQNA
jgi:hypothetical protein